MTVIDGTSGIDTVQKSALAGKLPAGSVLQVVNGTYASQTSTASTSYVDTGLTATITPISSTSKILVFVSQNGLQKSGVDIRVQLQLVRNGSNILSFESEILFTNASSSQNAVSSANYLDSPATTSAVTYKTQIRVGYGTGSVYWNTVGTGSIAAASTITLMEISG